MKKGIKVKMVNCYEATQHPATIWTTESDSWFLGSGEEVILLAGWRGGFAVECLKEVEEKPIPKDAICFSDGTCPKCGSFCGNNGYGGLKCECGWTQDEEEAQNDMPVAKEIFDEMFAEGDECYKETDNHQRVLDKLLSKMTDEFLQTGKVDYQKYFLVYSVTSGVTKEEFEELKDLMKYVGILSTCASKQKREG